MSHPKISKSIAMRMSSMPLFPLKEIITATRKVIIAQIFIIMISFVYKVKCFIHRMNVSKYFSDGWHFLSQISALQVLVAPFAKHTAYLRSPVVDIAPVVVALERASVFCNVLISDGYHVVTSQFGIVACILKP